MDSSETMNEECRVTLYDPIDSHPTLQFILNHTVDQAVHGVVYTSSCAIHFKYQTKRYLPQVPTGGLARYMNKSPRNAGEPCRNHGGLREENIL